MKTSFWNCFWKVFSREHLKRWFLCILLEIVGSVFSILVRIPLIYLKKHSNLENLITEFHIQAHYTYFNMWNAIRICQKFIITPLHRVFLFWSLRPSWTFMIKENVILVQISLSSLILLLFTVKMFGWFFFSWHWTICLTQKNTNSYKIFKWKGIFYLLSFSDLWFLSLLRMGGGLSIWLL